MGASAPQTGPSSSTEPKVSALRASVPCAFAEAVRMLEAHWYTDAELAQWLTWPHPQLDGKTAIEALAEGRKDDVYAVVKRLDDAAYL